MKGGKKGDKPPGAAAVAVSVVVPEGAPRTTGLATVPEGASEPVSILRRTLPKKGPCTVALAALGAEAPEYNYRSWLMDTGCKHDLTSRAAIPHHQHDSIFRSPVPITLSTANGLSSGNKSIYQQIGELGETAEPYILDSTPDVLSIGRRCVEDGCEFHWGPFSLEPTLTTRAGKVVVLRSQDCCPCLDDYEPDYTNLAAVAVGLESNDDPIKELSWDPNEAEYQSYIVGRRLSSGILRESSIPPDIKEGGLAAQA